MISRQTLRKQTELFPQRPQTSDHNAVEALQHVAASVTQTQQTPCEEACLCRRPQGDEIPVSMREAQSKNQKPDGMRRDGQQQHDTALGPRDNAECLGRNRWENVPFPALEVAGCMCRAWLHVGPTTLEKTFVQKLHSDRLVCWGAP